MNNVAFLDNPYKEGVIAPTRGVALDAKAAKLNNTAKRPFVVKHWQENRPKLSFEFNKEVNNKSKDYNSLLKSNGLTAVSHEKNVNSLGAKKLRVNKIVNIKTSTIYRSVEKEKIEPKEEVQSLINQINIVPTTAELSNEEQKREDVHGRHEKTGEIPVETVKEAVRNNSIPSRMERNALDHEEVAKDNLPTKEPKAGDMDLYNDLLHNEKEDDVSRQLQGARQELSLEKEESKKLAEQYGKAVKELEELKEDLENKKRIKAQQEKRELTETLNNIETLKRENLERTSNLSSIQAEIARLKAEKQAMESTLYEENRSFGRRAA